MMNIEKKVKISNKIFPYFYGLSSDLLFYIAIDTIFLNVIKGFSEAQINFFTSFGIIMLLILQPINIRVIKKIGNVNSIRLGVILLFISSIIITLSNNYYISLMGFALYELCFIFKSMENVILKRNLKYLNKDDEYIKVQSKGSFIYSFITMIIALIAGFLFNINPYLPMQLCIVFCFINIVLSFFLYEYKDENNTEVVNVNDFKISKLIILILACYGLAYSIMSLAQTNSKLFIQTNMLNILTIAISRVVRVVSNLIFPEVYKKIKDRILPILVTSLICALLLILIGNYIACSLMGIYIMSLGYFIFLAIRDPFQNYTKNLILNNCRKKDQERLITYMELSKNILKLLFSLLITLTLLKLKMNFVFYMFLVLSLVNAFISLKLYRMIKK